MYDCDHDHAYGRGCGHDDGVRGRDGRVRGRVHDDDHGVQHVNTPHSFLLPSPFPGRGILSAPELLVDLLN